MSGFPDWKDISQYPAREDALTYTQWAWEFLRRNKNYQQSYNATQNITDEADPKGQGLQMAASFGLTVGMLDPWTVTSSDISDSKIFFPVNKIVVGEYSAQLQTHQAAVIFDMRYPIDAQVAYIREALLDRQHYLAGRQLFPLSNTLWRIKEKVRPDKFTEYLRVLDAKACRVKNDDIADVLFPHLSNSYDSGSIGRNKVSKFYTAAKKLRDEAYLKIAIRDYLPHRKMT